MKQNHDRFLSLALSLAKQGIRGNAVAPGLIWTPLFPASLLTEVVGTFGRKTSQMRRRMQSSRFYEREGESC